MWFFFLQMWHRNLEAGELAGSSVGPIVGGVIAVGFHHQHHSDMVIIMRFNWSESMVVILSGNRPGGKSSGRGFPLDEEEKVSGRHLDEQGLSQILLKVWPALQCLWSSWESRRTRVRQMPSSKRQRYGKGCNSDRWESSWRWWRSRCWWWWRSTGSSWIFVIYMDDFITARWKTNFDDLNTSVI